MLHALPGMGADRRMYPPAWLSLPGFAAHDWIPHSGQRTLAEVARCMCETCRIEDGDILIGSSLGGMVACEISKIRNIPALYLIGSAVHRNEVSKFVEVLHRLVGTKPIDWARFCAARIPNELAQMFARSDPAFVRAMCSAVFEWEGLGPSTSRVYRIHGRHDVVIPAPKTVDLLLNGGHLISLSHAEACVKFIRANLPTSLG